jgi:hypothetical protein
VERTGGRVWLVVDGLDEAEQPSPGSNPLLLPLDLPTGVFVVVTRRAGRLTTNPGTPVQTYRLRRDDPLQTEDIKAFVRSRSASDSRIADALAASRPPMSLEQFVTTLVEASEGNFMYVSYVLAETVAPDDDASPLDLTNLPRGLRGYYDQFWARISSSQSQSWADWEALYQPVLERLAVAVEAVSADWLAAQVGRSPGEVRTRVLEPWARVLSRSRRDNWRLVHRTFGEYLEDKLDLRAAHLAVADSYVKQRWGQFDQWDAYGLRHAATHLARAADRSDSSGHYELTARLVRLVTEEQFQRAHLAGLHEPTLLRRDLELAHRLAAKDEHADATFLLVPVALTLVLFHRHLLQPEALFEAARNGDVQAAERLLDLFSGEIDPDWHDAILLTVAWLAADATDKARQEAVRVRDRIAGTGPRPPALTRLLEQVTAALGGAQAPPPQPVVPATPEQAALMLARIAGAGDASLLASVDVELQGGELRGDGGYLASRDGPALVALAAAEPAAGDPLLRRYLEVHRAYGYREYRNGSLWELLRAVLGHPKQDWVREWATQLGLVVLAAPNRGEFLEGLEIAVLALQARAGDGDVAVELVNRASDAVAAASALPDSPLRGQGDVWGTHRRRLAAMAEAFSQLPDLAPQAAGLTGVALSIGRGFAGLTAPANLTVAETASIAAPGDAVAAGLALAAAEEAAHHIQDATFRARTTARVRAMRWRWWPEPPLGPAQVADAIERLSTDRSGPEFGAVHVVGDPGPGDARPLPPLVLAESLEQLAAVYQRPLRDFLRHNQGENQGRGWAPDERLAQGTIVNVPDPGFPPLVAARLSAAALAGGPPGSAQSALLRHLVPVTGADVTALGTVLARLLLCSPTHDLPLLAELRHLVTQTAAVTTAE